MKNTFLRTILVIVSLSLICFSALSQNKSQAYYNSHEREILPDAQVAFQNGEYDRAIELCKWHYIIVGDQKADQLRRMSDRCAQLSRQMKVLVAEGNTQEALDVARTLLTINSNDPTAKKLTEEAARSVVSSNPVIPEDTVPVNAVEETVVEQSVVIPPVKEEPDWTEPVTEVPLRPTPANNPEVIGSRFVLKAGLAVLDMKQFSKTISPGLSAGLYDIGGGRMGAEVGAYLCPGSAPLFGMDASVVFQVAKNVYPKAGIGFFSCKQSGEDVSATHGLCAGIGLTYFMGKNLCLELGLKYYPTVKIHTVETDAGHSYSSVREVLSGGIAPSVSIGWAF